MDVHALLTNWRNSPSETLDAIFDVVESDGSHAGNLEFGMDKHLLAMAKAEGVSDTERMDINRDRVAFMLSTGGPKSANKWGQHFGPLGTSNGSTPPKEAITPDSINLWRARSARVMRPVLVARYADAAWDLARFAGCKADHLDARRAIDAYVNSIECQDRGYAKLKRLRRALHLALSISDHDRVDRSRDALLASLQQANRRDRRRSAMAAFDELLSGRNNARVSLADVDRIVTALEESLALTIDLKSDIYDVSLSLKVGRRLIMHYRRTHRQSEFERVAAEVGGFLESVSSSGNAMRDQEWLERAHDLYHSVGLMKDAERVLMKLKHTGKMVAAEMKPISVEVKISNEEVQKIAESLTDGTVDEALRKFGMGFVFRRTKLQQEMEDAFGGTLMAHMPVKIHGDQQTIANMGSMEEDPEGWLVHYALTTRLGGPESLFLQKSLDRLFERHQLTPAAFVALIASGSLSLEDRHQILTKAIEAYRAGNHITAIHLLVPQIEHAIRALLARFGRPSNLSKGDGTFEERTLDNALRDKELITFLSEDVAFYLRAVLTHKIGWNIRNRVAHGLMRDQHFIRDVSDRLVHILLVLSAVSASEAA